MQAVLTIIPGAQTDLSDAVALGAQMKAQGRIFDCRPAVPPRGLSVILNDGASGPERIAIANEFKALGYACIELP
ncbi:MAG: hypothetical protein ACLQAT_13535 [Candidatus Binataceae bacterium]